MSLKSLLSQFAQFIGEKDKELKQELSGSINTAKTEAINTAATAADAKINTAKGEIQSQIQSAVSALKTELIGGASEELDTFKELAEELAKLKANGSSVPESLVTKITEIKGTADGVKSDIDSITLQELKNSYTAALS
jgi:hypothetical protein|nr:MAG TPA: hypothetical protein [Caudoviricetes sp.]